MVMGVDLDREFAGGDQLRNQRAAAFADIQLLCAEAAGDLFAFFVAVVIHDRSEPVVGVFCSADFAFPTRSLWTSALERE